MRKVTTGPTSVTVAADSAGVWIAMATRWLVRAPMALQTAVGKAQRRTESHVYVFERENKDMRSDLQFEASLKK